MLTPNLQRPSIALSAGRMLMLGMLTLGLVACSADTEEDITAAKTDSAKNTQADTAAIAAAMSSDARPDTDTARDANRKPAAVLALAGIAPGQRVADIGSGGGYYVRILREALGNTGEVIAFNPDWVIERFPSILDAVAAQESAGHGPAGNWAKVTGAQSPMQSPAIGAENSLDAVLMVLFYHDAYWNNVDTAVMNAAIYKALKPGGRYVVVDHAAEAGSGIRDVQTIHRVDPAQPLAEITAAGFTLKTNSQLLANSDDPRTENVFGEIRGKTDRFVYVFEKPGS